MASGGSTGGGETDTREEVEVYFCYFAKKKSDVGAVVAKKSGDMVSVCFVVPDFSSEEPFDGIKYEEQLVEPFDSTAPENEMRIIEVLQYMNTRAYSCVELSPQEPIVSVGGGGGSMTV